MARAGSTLLHGAARWLRRAARNWRGVSAIEFALIFPLLILLYVAAAETGNMLTINRRTFQIASTAADLTAQVKTVSNADLADIVTASNSIMSPFATVPLRTVISSVVADQSNNGKVSWSYASSGAARGVNSPYPVPTGLTEPGSSVIVAEVTYDFTPLVDVTKFMADFFSSAQPSLLFKSIQISQKFYARPRKSLTVTKTN